VKTSASVGSITRLLVVLAIAIALTTLMFRLAFHHLAVVPNPAAIVRGAGIAPHDLGRACCDRGWGA
jgi:hypothetical protein